MPVTSCCVPGCSSKKGGHTPVYSLPRDGPLQQLWSSYITPLRSDFVSLKPHQLRKKLICKRHFESRFFRGDVRLHQSCPTLFTNEEIAMGIPRRPVHFVSHHAENYGDHCYASSWFSAPPTSSAVHTPTTSALESENPLSPTIGLSDDLKVCRICLSSVDLLPLFPSLTPAGCAGRQCDLHLATGVTMVFNDGLPQAICKSCSELVNSALYLRNRSLHSERKLLDTRCKIKLGSSTGTESIVLIPVSKSMQHVDIDNEFSANSFSASLFREDINTDAIDFMDTNSSVPVFEQMDIPLPYVQHDPKKTNKHQTTENTYKKKTPRSKEKENVLPFNKNAGNEKRKELKLIEKIKRCEEFTEGPLDINGSICCKVCKRTCNGLSSFSIHLRIHTGRDHVCEFCGKKFYAAITLKRHCMSWHGLEKEFSCAHCQYRATSIPRLREHERTHTGERPYKCSECGRSYHTRGSIVQHLRSHMLEKTVQCDRCPSMFKTRRAMMTHYCKCHIRDYLYLCYMCDRRYSKTTTVRRHLAIVHGVPQDRQCRIPRFSRSRAAIVN